MQHTVGIAPRSMRSNRMTCPTEQDRRARALFAGSQPVRYRVLVVEDEELMRSIIVAAAARRGLRGRRGARGAKSRWQIFEREKIDLAILDLNLSGGGSGLDVLKQDARCSIPR